MSTDLVRPITIAEAARRTGRSVATIRRWMANPAPDRKIRRYPDGRLVELDVLNVEHATRAAARAGRPGARPRVLREAP